MKYLLLFVIGTILLAYLILKYVNLVQENFENPKIYISMSTIPSRIDFLKPVLESLLNQVIPPSHIYINVPLKYKRFNTPLVIPDWLILAVIVYTWLGVYPLVGIFVVMIAPVPVPA